MNREPEQYSNQHNESKSEQQTRLANEALRRAHTGDGPFMGGAPPQSAVVSGRGPATTPIPTSDAQLSWAGGEHFVSPAGPGDTPFTAEIARAAGISAAERSNVSPIPEHFGQPPLIPAPRCLESNSGRHLNTADILADLFRR